MAETQEYQDCDSIRGLRSSASVEISNFNTSIEAVVALMTIIDADAPRRAKFDTMYGKIDSSYNKAEFDAFVVKCAVLKQHLIDEGWIEEE